VNDNSIPITVHILGKEYRVACQRGEEEGLRASAGLLDGKMRQIKSGGKVIGTDRIAVMAALNLAHELLQHTEQKEQGSQSINKRVREMRLLVEHALNQGNPQLEL